MSILLKKVTSTVSVLAIAASAIGATASVSAASEFLMYAESLSEAGIINAGTEAQYRLGDNITRAEVAKIAVNVSGVEMYECVGDVFSDVGTSLGDLCDAVETAAVEGFVNADATNFRPTALVTRAEMVKMLLAAKGVEPSDYETAFMDTESLGDLTGYINAGVEVGALRDGQYFRPNANATRGEAFKVASTIMSIDMDDNGTDNGTDNGNGTSTGTTSTGTTSTGVVMAGDLSVMSDSSAMQFVPRAGTVEAGKFTFAAKSSDVTVRSIVMKRGGLGDRNNIESVWFEYMGKRVTTQASVNSDETVTLSFTPAWKLMAGTTASLDLVVKLRTPGASGAQHNFAIVAANNINSTSATLAATFPIVSNTIVTTDYTTAAVTFNSISETPKTVKAGEKDVILGEFRVTVTGTKDVMLKNVTLYNDGDLDVSSLENLAIYSKVTGAKVSSNMMVDGRNVMFTLNDTIPFTNSSRNYELRADILGIDKTSESLQFTFDGRSENLIAKEVTTGYRTSNTLTPTGNKFYKITVEAGAVSVVDSGNTANVDVAAGQNDIVLARGKITAKESVKLRDVKLTLAQGSGATLSQVRLNIAGQSISFDGSQFTTNATVYTVNNTYVVDAGTYDFTVTADVRADAGNQVYRLADITLPTDIRYTASDRLVTDASGRVTGIQNTVKSATISISNNSIARTNVVGGVRDISLLKYTLNNNNVSDLTVTGEQYTAMLMNTTSATADRLRDLSVALYINGTMVASKNATSFAMTGATNATVNLDFSSTTFKVLKGQSASIELKTATLPRFANAETLTVSRVAPSGNTNITDVNGNPVNVSNAAVTSYGLVIANPALDLAIASDDSSEILLANAGLVELAKIRARATNDNLSIKELYLGLSYSGTQSVANAERVARLINEVQLVDATGKVLGNGTVLRNGAVAFIKFNSIEGATVARNTDMILTVKAAVGSLSEAADSGFMVNVTIGAGATTGDTDVDTAADFAVVAEGSTITLESTNSGSVAVATASGSKLDLVTSGKLVAAASTVSNAAAGQVQFTLTNNGSDAVLVKSLTLKSGNATAVKLYKGSVTNGSERLDNSSASASGAALTGAIDVSMGATTLEIQAGQTVTILADFDNTAGAGLSSGDNTVNVSFEDVSYADKVQGAYSMTAIPSIAAYKNTGLPASTSFRVSGTAGY